MDILPPPKRPQPAQSTQTPLPPVIILEKPQQTPAPYQPKHYSRKPRWPLWILAALGLFVVLALGVIGWYQWSLRPVDAQSDRTAHVLVEDGDSSATVIDKLNTAGVIRSRLATRLYIELSGTKQVLKAGGYIVSPKQGLAEMIQHIALGKTDEQLVTIPPGRTLKQLSSDLKQYGYTDQNISEAFEARYNSPLLASKPADATLEGYIFPESFSVSVSTPLNDLFERSFDELYARLQKDGMIEKFKARGLNLHQAMTLASIVQKEVSNPIDQRQVAQVFLKRLSMNISLGSDVTFEYAAAQHGVTPAVDIDSPYNTRQRTGLPPGPIANMNYEALQAVADPAPGDFLFFVAGDDGTTYYSHTIEEHEANTAAHCHTLCN